MSRTSTGHVGRRDPIPDTQLFRFYKQLRHAHQADRLVEAERLVKQPALLAKMFAESVLEFAGYSNIDEPFHPRPCGELPSKGGFAGQVTGRRVAYVLARASKPVTVKGASDLKLIYVDHEVKPARTTGGAVYADGPKSKSTIGMNLDLLLRDPAGTPAICEVKAPNDMDPFFAVVQVLACTAQLVSRAQRQRLACWYPKTKFKTDGPIDVFVLQVTRDGHPRGPFMPRLTAAANDLIHLLGANKTITKHIRTIAVLTTPEESLKKDELRLSVSAINR